MTERDLITALRQADALITELRSLVMDLGRERGRLLDLIGRSSDARLIAAATAQLQSRGTLH